jgi:hypothetical protein
MKIDHEKTHDSEDDDLVWSFYIFTGLVGILNILILGYFFSIECGTGAITAYTYGQAVAIFGLFGMAYLSQRYRDDGYKIASFVIYWTGIYINVAVAIWGLVVVFSNKYGHTVCFNIHEQRAISYIPVSSLCLAAIYGMVYIYNHFKYADDEPVIDDDDGYTVAVLTNIITFILSPIMFLGNIYMYLFMDEISILLLCVSTCYIMVYMYHRFIHVKKIHTVDQAKKLA